MPVRSLSRTFVIVLLLLAAAATGASSAAAYDWYDWPGMKKCSKFKSDGLSVMVYKKKVTCRKAKRIVRKFRSGRGVVPHQVANGDDTVASTYYTIDGYKGWKCREGSGGGTCTKGKSTAGWQLGPA